MAKFCVNSAFVIEDRHLFVLAGSIIDGEIRAGMFLRAPSNSNPVVMGPIHSIEFAKRIDRGEDICLCVQTDPKTLELWRGLAMSGEIVEIISDDSNQ